MITNMAEKDYHELGLTSVSSTLLKNLWVYPPSKVKAMLQAPPTKAMNFGSAAHAHILGEGPKLIVWQHPGTTRAGKEERAENSDALAVGTHIAVTAQEYEIITGMASALGKSREVVKILEESVKEVSLFWEEPGGIPARARVDILGPDRALDYKTTLDASSEGFARALADYGYHQQAEWYQRGLAANRLAPGDRPMAFLMQEKTPPYLFQIHTPDQAALLIASEINDRALKIYERCVRENDWPGFDRLEDNPTGLPAYYFYRHEALMDKIEGKVF